MFTSCSLKIQPIEYGIDNCEFCKMGIVDNKHASQIVTLKGKNYKFDAIECMISYIKKDKNDINSYAHILVCNLENPGELINANSASFIISKNIPSPMGAFLSATKSQTFSQKIIEQYTGEQYTFEQLIEKLTNQ